MKGLVNVSGFHADPGWQGQLIFAVFNAGPAPVHLHQGLPLFLVWFADLDQESEKSKTNPGFDHIPAAIINTLTGGINSLNALDKRMSEEVKIRRNEDDKLSNRIHDLEKSQTRLAHRWNYIDDCHFTFHIYFLPITNQYWLGGTEHAIAA